MADTAPAPGNEVVVFAGRLKKQADRMREQGQITAKHHAEIHAKADAAMKKGKPARKPAAMDAGPR